MELLLGNEYLCSLIFSHNDPYTLVCICQRVCKKWRLLLSSHESDCFIWKTVYKFEHTSPQTHAETQAQWVALNKSIYRSNIATYQNLDDNKERGQQKPHAPARPPTPPTCDSPPGKTDNQGKVWRGKSLEKRRTKKPSTQTWRNMVQLCCVPTPRNLHFLYLKGRATEIHSGTEFRGNFDILMLGWSCYFIRIQGDKFWRFSLVVDEFYCRFLRIFVGRPLRTRTRRLCFEEREEKGGSQQLNEVGRVLFSSTSQRLLGLTGPRDDRIKLGREGPSNITFNTDLGRSMTFEQPYHYPTLHCTLPHSMTLADKLLGKYLVDKVYLLDKYVSEGEARAWFGGLKEKSNTERSSYWDEIKQLV